MSLYFASSLPADEHAQWREALAAALPEERFVDEPGTSVDVALVANPPPGALAGLPGLRLIQSLWAGVERLLADPTVPVDVPLARMVDPLMSRAMAETALWAVLGLHRDFFTYARQQQAGVWAVHPQRRADEVVVAVLGLGRIGAAVAERLAGNHYRVLGWSARPATLAGIETRSGDAALADVLGAADVIVNLLPLTDTTRGLFDAHRLALCKPGAALVNLARGGHVVDEDLAAALDSGRLVHAVLDVFHEEPLPPGHRWWSHPQVSVLPHTAAQTDVRSAAGIAAANVRRLRAGEPPQDLVDRARGY